MSSSNITSIPKEKKNCNTHIFDFNCIFLFNLKISSSIDDLSFILNNIDQIK